MAHSGIFLRDLAAAMYGGSGAATGVGLSAVRQCLRAGCHGGCRLCGSDDLATAGSITSVAAGLARLGGLASFEEMFRDLGHTSGNCRRFGGRTTILSEALSNPHRPSQPPLSFTFGKSRATTSRCDSRPGYGLRCATFGRVDCALVHKVPAKASNFVNALPLETTRSPAWSPSWHRHSLP